MTEFIWAVERWRIIFHSLRTDQQIGFVFNSIGSGTVDRSYLIYPILDHDFNLRTKLKMLRVLKNLLNDQQGSFSSWYATRPTESTHTYFPLEQASSRFHCPFINMARTKPQR
ncbi:hypothetical protein V5G28_006115 [Scytonema sp. PRP1]